MTVILFDMRSIGIDIYLKKYESALANIFNTNNVKLELVYVVADSIFGKDCGNEKSQYIDIGFFAYSFPRLFRQYQPDVVVTTHQTNLISRALIRMCKKSKIPILYVQHATIPIQTFRKSRKISSGAVKKYYLQWKAYARSSFLKSVSISSISYLLGGLARKNVLTFPPFPNEDNRCDHALVKNNFYRDYLVKNIGYRSTDITVVGNDELMAEKAVSFGNRKRTSTVLYVMQPVVEDGFMELSSFLMFLDALSNFCSSQDLILYAKPHPRNDSNTISVVRSHAKILNEGVSQLDFSKYDLVISHNSSLALKAVVSKTPLLLFEVAGLDTHNLLPFASLRAQDKSSLLSSLEFFISDLRRFQETTDKAYRMLFETGELPKEDPFDVISQKIFLSGKLNEKNSN